MKKNLKLLISFTLIVLSLAVPQAIQGSEDQGEIEKQNVAAHLAKNTNEYYSSVIPEQMVDSTLKTIEKLQEAATEARIQGNDSEIVTLDNIATKFTIDLMNNLQETDDASKTKMDHNVLIQENALPTQRLSSLSFEDKRNIYHSRDSYSREPSSIPGRGGMVMGFVGPKPREGGLGPTGSIEISPWVKSVNWIRSMKEGDELEFVFDPDIDSVYVGVNSSIVIGHSCLRDISSAKNPYGGNIKKAKNGGVFRTDELSGHFGAKWNDVVRFKFIEVMYVKGLEVLHEPWVRDSVVLEKSKTLHEKKASMEKLVLIVMTIKNLEKLVSMLFLKSLPMKASLFTKKIF